MHCAQCYKINFFFPVFPVFLFFSHNDFFLLLPPQLSFFHIDIINCFVCAIIIATALFILFFYYFFCLPLLQQWSFAAYIRQNRCLYCCEKNMGHDFTINLCILYRQCAIVHNNYRWWPRSPNTARFSHEILLFILFFNQKTIKCCCRWMKWRWKFKYLRFDLITYWQSAINHTARVHVKFTFIIDWMVIKRNF